MSKVSIGVGADFSEFNAQLQAAETRIKSLFGEFANQLQGVEKRMGSLKVDFGAKPKLSVDTSEFEAKLAALQEEVKRITDAQAGHLSQFEARLNALNASMKRATSGSTSGVNTGGTSGVKGNTAVIDVELKNLNDRIKKLYDARRKVAEEEKALKEDTEQLIDQRKKSLEDRKKVASDEKKKDKEESDAREKKEGRYRRAERFAGALGGVVGSMSVGGTDGGVMGAIGAGTGGLLGAATGWMTGSAATGMIAGSFLSRAGGGIGSAIDSALSEAIGQTYGISDLRNSLGALNTGFADLTRQSEYLGANLGVTSGEALQLAQRFVKTAGTEPGDEFADQVRHGIGYGRGLGVDPSRSVAFFAEMKKAGAVQSADDQRRLGATIVESIAKGGGGFAKSEEVLTAIAGFVGQMARQNLTTPNIDAFASSLSGITGMHIPGMDASGAAGLIGQANQGYINNRDEAVQNLRLAMQGRGFSAFDLDMVTGQGLFGTRRKGLQVAHAQALQFGDKKTAARLEREMESPGSDNMNGVATLDALRRLSGGNYTLYKEYGKTMFGVNDMQFMALDKGLRNPATLHQLRGLDKLPAKNQAMAAQIMMEGDPEKLKQQARRFISGADLNGSLAQSDKDVLNAQMNDPEALRRSLLKLMGKVDFADEGQDLRQKVVDVKDAIVKFSQELVPAVGKVKDAILFAMGKNPGDFDRTMATWKAGYTPEKLDILSSLVNQNQIAESEAKKDVDKELRPAIPGYPGTGWTQADHDRAVTRYEVAKQHRIDAEAKLRKANDDINQQMKQSGETSGGQGWFGEMEPVLNDTPGDIPGLSRKQQNEVKEAMRRKNPWARKTAEVTRKYGLPEHLLDTVMFKESRFNPRAGSPKGAGGLMQFMTATARRFGLSSEERFDPEKSIDASGQYFRSLLNMFHGDIPKALGGYNAGEGAVQNAVKESAKKGGNYFNRLPRETRDYIQVISTIMKEKKERNSGNVSNLDYSNEKIPTEAHSPKPSSSQREPLNINLSGRFLADGFMPLNTQTSFSVPMASGALNHG